MKDSTEKRKISIFAKPPFEIKHLMRVSSIIRGEQLAAYMQNARLNPSGGYEDDICIYVKPNIRAGNDYHFEKHSWIDIHDAPQLTGTLNKYPDVGCITISDDCTRILKKQIKNRIVTIPHHHMNLENVTRDENRGINIVGVTGSPSAFQFIPDEIRKGLAERNISLVEWSHFYPRTSVCKFHSKIDIQLIWRPQKKGLSSPLKITNAGSFGVPTIALTTEEPSFEEVAGCYIGVSTPEEWLSELDTLRADDGTTTDRYKELAKTNLETMRKYHIDNNIKLFEQLT